MSNKLDDYIADHWEELAEQYWKEKMVPGELENFLTHVVETPHHEFWAWAQETAEGYSQPEREQFEER